MIETNNETSRRNNQPQESTTGFDLTRAILRDKDLFAPFHVTSTYPLREARAGGAVRNSTPVLVMNHQAGILAFLTQQIVSHHLAWGEMEGRQWMVIF